MECGAQCHGEIKLTDNVLSCNGCLGKYHRQCLGISKEQYDSLHPEIMKTWVCPSCTNVNTRRRRTNPETPVRKHQVPAGAQILDMSLDRSLTASGVNHTLSDIATPISCFTEDRETVTLGKISTLLDQKIQTSVSSLIEEKLNSSLSAFMNTFRAAIQEDVRKLVQSEIKSAVKDLECNFTATTDFICAEQDTQDSRLEPKQQNQITRK
jgi:hypothetical protein